MAPGVQSVDRAFAVLRAVATAAGGVSDISRRTGLAVTTTARLLGALEGLGAVTRQDPGPTFRIGPGVTDLAAAADPAAGLVERARAHLEALVAAVGETAGISVADGDRHVLYLDRVEATEHDVTLRDLTGERLPLHVVSSGLVMLAARDAAGVREYIAGGLERFTDHTTTDAAGLRRRLVQVRLQGHAWTVEEYVEGICSVAAPIRDGAGEVVAALHVHGPSYRLKESDGRVTAAVLAAAARM